MRRLSLVLIALVLAAVAGHAQTLQSTCPATSTLQSPCQTLAWTNASMAATQTNNAKGQETSGPGTAEVWSCNGSATSTQCAAAMLPAIGSETLPTGSGWSLAGTIAQTTSAGAAAIPNLTYGALYQFVVRNLWTAGGGAGAFSPNFQSQIPAAPQTQPGSPSTLSGTIVVPAD